MHELSLAQNIVSIVRSELSRLSISESRLRGVRLTIGKLMQVVPASLLYGLEIIGEENGFKNVRYAVNECPLKIACTGCGAESEIETFVLRCGKCGSEKIKVVGGREFVVDSIDIDD